MKIFKLIHNLFDFRSKNMVKIVLLSAIFFLLFGSFVIADSTTTSSPNGSDTTIDCTWKGTTSASIYSLTEGIFPGTTPLSYCSTSAGSLVGGQSTQPTGEVLQQLKSMNANPNAYIQGGGMGMLAQVAYNVSTPPVTTYDSITYVASKFAPSVSAQTSALTGLAPVLVLHGILRNVAYAFIVIAMVLTGFVLIVQNKNQKQGNVGAATNITELITILIFITLSYPIAGVLIDVIVNLGNSVIATFLNPFINSNQILSQFYQPGSSVNILSLLSQFQSSGVSPSLVNLLQAGLQNLQPAVQQSAGFLQNPSIGAVAQANHTSNLALGVFASIVGIYLSIGAAIATSSTNSALILAIISFTIFILIFRVVFMLLGAFVNIVIQVMFAPLILVSGAFPGVSASKAISNWIKNIIGASIVFPVTFAVILLAALFLNFSKTNANNTSCFYDNQDTVAPKDRTYITGNQSLQYNSIQKNASNQSVNSDYFDVQRASNYSKTNTVLGDDTYGSIRQCFPKLLPPKFNWLPAPIGYFGFSFQVDDFTRFVLGISFIVIAPSLPKILQGALGLKPSPLSDTAKDAFAGVNIFSGFVGQIPVIGKPISQLLGSLQGAIK